MSRNSQRDLVTVSPTAGDWDVQSLHSDDENSDYKDFTSERGSNNNSELNGNTSTNHDEKASRKKSRKPNQSSHAISRKVWKVFKIQNATPPGGRVTPIADDNDRGPGPVLKAFSRKSERGDEFVMKNFRSHRDKVKVVSRNSENDAVGREQSITRCSNPAYIPSLEEEEAERNHTQPSRNRRSYEAPIYSVNSAGRPVPITIEESENEEDDDMNDEFAANERRPESRRESFDTAMPTASSIFVRNVCCCTTPLDKSLPEAARERAEMMWRKTYQPDSMGIFLWLCVITTAFLYNLWAIPLRATFVTEIQSSWKDIWFALDAICDLIFIVDIFVKFRTSFIQSGVFVTDLDQLNRRHRKEWTLILDVFAIVPTDLLFLHSINPYFRLNRILKVHRVYTFYQRGELSTWSPSLWRTINLLHIFFVVIHYNACFYYALSEANGFGTLLTSWSYPNPNFFPDYASLYRRYTYSFYWCMVGLGLVNDRYFPENDWQFLFSIYLHLLGLAFLIGFIGFVTVLMFGKGAAKFEFEKTIQNTKEYMEQRKLPKDLRSRVLRFYQYSWVSEQFSQLDEKSMLRYLPTSVRQEIELHSNLTALKQIPSLANCDSKILQDLVMRLRRCIYLPGQIVYRSGDIGTEMYIVGEGILQVVGDNNPSIYTLRDGDVFGEIDLLNETIKRRTADVISYGYSELYMLTCDDVMETFRKYPKFMNLVQQQEKRRRTMMTSSAKECKAFGSKYQMLPLSGMKSATDSKISASRVHFRMSSGDGRGLAGPLGSSPDSGIPSSLSMGMSYAGDTPTTVPHDPMKAELTEKIASMYQDHMRSLKTSLDGIWFQEISYLHQRLDDTEQERDLKAREVTHLRRQLSNVQSAENTQTKTGNTPTENKGGNVQSKATASSQRNGNVDADTSVDQTDNSHGKVIRSVKQTMNEFEKEIQPFGSISSTEL